MEHDRRIEELDLIGGDPALDFCNTLGGARAGPWDDEWLGGYDDLAGWAAHAGLLSAATAAALRRAARAHAAAAAAVHARALVHREAAYRVFAGLAAGERPAAADLAALRDAQRDALGHAELRPAGVRLDWRWTGAEDLERPLWPAAQAVVDLLRSDRLERLKQCANCRWLYLDASRNQSRRWCSMAACGTSAKMEARRGRRA